MFTCIAIKDSKIITIHETEWECRKEAKGLTSAEYWIWLESVTTKDVPDYSGEDYEVVETEVDVRGFNVSGHIHEDETYSLKWHASKKEVVKDDTAKAAWELTEEWKQIRTERTKLLVETDWTQGGDSPLTDAKKTAWATYRTSLRTLPEDQKSKTKYSDITWPTKPS